MTEDHNIKSALPVEVLNDRDLTKDIRIVKKEFSFGKYLSREDVNERLSRIPQDRPKHMMFFQFLWRSGVRVTEAIELRKGQIRFEDKTIVIRWLKNRKYQSRVIPMHSSLRNPLYLLCAALKADERVFPWSRQRADQLAKKYGFGHCHVLRHSFAVNYIKQSPGAWALKILQQLLGHSRIQTTMKYLEAFPADQAAALEEVRFD